MNGKGLASLLLTTVVYVFGQTPHDAPLRVGPSSELALVPLDTIHDVGVVAIADPKGTIDSNAVLAPACTVANFGTEVESYAVRMRIGSFYDSTADVVNHAPATRLYIAFPPCQAWPRGTQAVSCSTMLADDGSSSNDRWTGQVMVSVHDVECVRIIAPLGTADSGTVITPACSVYNAGTSSESYYVAMKIGSLYSQAYRVSGHAPATFRRVLFTNWVAGPRGTWPVSCSTQLAADLNPGNDGQADSVTVQVRDIACTAITAPSGAVDSGTVVSPACSVANFGSVPASYTARLKIGTQYNNTVDVTDQAPGTQISITFPDWPAPEPGRLAVSCSTELASDNQPLNDRIAGAVLVRRNGPDVGCVRIMAPVGLLTVNTPVTPACSLFNFGSLTVSYSVRMRIGAGYDSSATVTSQGPGTAVYVTFPVWIASPLGSHTVAAFSLLNADICPANDTLRGTVQVGSGQSGWVRQPDMPLGVRHKSVKDGGCLAFAPETAGSRGPVASLPNPDDGMIYALKGNNTCEFYRYSISDNAWTALESIPAYNRLRKKKLVKKGACITVADGKVYATKGNGTYDFWVYTPGTPGSWAQLPDVPTGVKSLKEGTSAVAVPIGDTTYIYLMKGSGTFEFYRYNTVSQTWLTMPSLLPGPKGKGFKSGSCLAFDPDRYTLYALKGSYNEFSIYYLSENVWLEKPQLPLAGRSGNKKKLKDGGGLAYHDNNVFALKGGGTREFWVFTINTSLWNQSEDLPLGGGKTVKGGGGLTGGSPGLFALKGNNTVEFYRFVFSDLNLGHHFPTVTAAQSQAPDSRGSNLALRAPDIMRPGSRVNYVIPRAGRVSLKLYGLSGSLVATLVQGVRGAGSYATRIDQARLAPGIYLLRLQAGDEVLTRKFIIE